MSKKTKKPSPTPPTKGKAAPKKTKPVVEAKKPEAQSAPMKAGLAAVAAMPVGKTSKLNAITELLMRPAGATVNDLIAVTGWQKHTVRAALSHALAKKRGYQIVSEKPANGQRIYKITGISRREDAPKDDH